MKKRFLILLLLAFCAIALPLMANAELKGTCGKDLLWTLNDSKVLTISGTGSMNDYSSNPAPWGTDIKKVRVQEGVTSLGSRAFSDCSELSSVQLADSVKSIGSFCFSGCTSLTNLEMPEKMTALGQGAFYKCSGLTEATVPEGITFIDYEVFFGCTSLKKVHLPSTLTTIQSGAFENTALTDVYFNDTEAKWNSIDKNHYTGSLLEAATKHFVGIGPLPPEATPTITKQPSDVSVVEGNTATFKVGASNADTYQWYWRASEDSSWTAVDVDGDTEALVVSGNPEHNRYQYYCVVSNTMGSVESDIATLIVFTKPTITSQPTSLSVCAGDTVTFSMSASGEGLMYQWWVKKPGEESYEMISAGGDTETLTFVAEAQDDGNLYCCGVYNNAGQTFTDIVSLSVTNTLINGQPSDVKVKVGTTATFKVTPASGCSCQWYVRASGDSEWTAIKENGTSATLRFTASQWHDGNQYRCKVSDATGYVYSDIATLTVISKPTITLQPTSVRVSEGTMATFSVRSDDADTFQWYYRTSLTSNWIAVKVNGTYPDYSLIAQARHNGYQYCCKVSNSVDSTYSEVATLSVEARPVITQQPVNVSVNEGATATFKVVATNVVSYQWYYRTSSSAAWHEVTVRGTSSTYSLATQARHDGYQYRCQLTNDFGFVYSDVATLTLNPKPAIIVQPKNVKVKPGEVATFSLTAVGADSYQWYYRTSSKDVWSSAGSNAIFDTYSVNTESFYNGYQFRCLLKNSAGSVFSNTVTLTVELSPIISNQPQDVTVKEGETAVFKVVSKNATSFEWYYRPSQTAAWQAVSKNGTSATYKLTAEPRHNHYQYRCKVKNSTGSAYSEIATLTVRYKPIITVQPNNVTVNEGEKATFKVKANNAVSYKWYYRKTSKSAWNPVLNYGTSASYSLTVEPRHNGYQYRVLVTNNMGSVYSNTVTLKVTEKPIITGQPANVTMSIGGTATFKVKALKADSYQWYYLNPTAKEWTKVQTRGTSSTYSVKVEKRHNRYKYRCVVTNKSGSVTTQAATLTVVSVPAITAQPKSVSVLEGNKATFKVTATNATKFAWYYRKTPSSSWSPVTAGGTSATYSLTVAQRHNGYQYRCQVKNSYGSIYSDIVTLTVLKLPVIESQPRSQTVSEGVGVILTVYASDATSYQWYILRPGEKNWEAITKNGNSSSYAIKAQSDFDGSKFKCVVKNSAGSVTSSVATLTIK